MKCCWGCCWFFMLCLSFSYTDPDQRIDSVNKMTCLWTYWLINYLDSLTTWYTHVCEGPHSSSSCYPKSLVVRKPTNLRLSVWIDNSRSIALINQCLFAMNWICCMGPVSNLTVNQCSSFFMFPQDRQVDPFCNESSVSLPLTFVVCFFFCFSCFSSTG